MQDLPELLLALIGIWHLLVEGHRMCRASSSVMHSSTVFFVGVMQRGVQVAQPSFLQPSPPTKI